MKIGGLQKFSLIDYPGKISAVVFTQGCNLRCGYCHNPQLVYYDQFGPLIPQEEVLDFLSLRRGQLDGVVVTGGEPTIQEGLSDFLYCVKAMGYLVKLDTNGTNPGVLKDLIGLRLVDYIAMDIKAPLDKYNLVCGVSVDTARIMQNIDIMQSSSLAYHFRTTFAQDLLTGGDIAQIHNLIKFREKHLLQECVAPKVTAA